MFAWTQGQTEKSALECTGKRGGVVVNENSLQVVSPEEFFAAYQETQQRESAAKALVEYSFIIDSADMDGSFKALEEASSTIYKDLAYSYELSDCLVTIYKADGSFQTVLLASYEPDLTKSMMRSSESAIHLMNVSQLTSIVEQLSKQLGGARFTIAIPDPSPEASNCFAPQSFDENELQQKGYSYEPAQYEDWMAGAGIDKKYTRTVGSGGNFAFPQASFPWVLATKKAS
jgi:hypothetical protein